MDEPNKIPFCGGEPIVHPKLVLERWEIIV
jgi:hypothetical protein